MSVCVSRFSGLKDSPVNGTSANVEPAIRDPRGELKAFLGSSSPKRRKRVADAAAAGAVGMPTEVKPEPVETDFAAALKMLAQLPLSNEDRAEAVRLLLRERG